MAGTQKARDNSLQIQTNNLNVGLTETDVRNILSNEKELILKEAEIIAIDTAQKRLDDYAEILIPKLVNNEMLQAFANPAIQMFYKNIEKSVICTDRKSDYEMLSELLIHRVEKDDDYVAKAAINKIVDIIDDISEEALSGLTMLFSTMELTPTNGNVLIGLQTMDNHYKRLLDSNKLPIEDRWIDNLELVQAIKILPYSSTASFIDLFSRGLDGYFKDGIRINSDKYNEYQEKLKKVNLPLELLEKNEFLENYYRIPVSNKDGIKKMRLIAKFPNGIQHQQQISEKQIEVLEEIYDNYDNISSNIEIVKNNIYEKMEEYKNIKRIEVWWNENLYNKRSIVLTTIGEILAQVNAKRFDNAVPKVGE